MSVRWEKDTMKSVKSAFRRVLREVGAVSALTALAGIVFLIGVNICSHFGEVIGTEVIVILLFLPVVIGLAQFIFGERKWRRGLIRGVAAILLLFAVGLACLRSSSDTIEYVVEYVGKLALGQGMWAKRVGTAEMDIDGRKIAYDVYSGKVTYPSCDPAHILLLRAKGEIKEMPHEGLFEELVARSDALVVPGGVYMISLSIPFQPLICEPGVPITSHGKIECVEKFEIVEAGDTLEYRIGVVYYKQTAAGVDETRQSYVLKIPRRFFGSNCQTPFRPAVPARADWDESVDDTGIGD